MLDQISRTWLAFVTEFLQQPRLSWIFFSYSHTHTHPFMRLLDLLYPGRGLLEPIPAVKVREARYTLDQVPSLSEDSNFFYTRNYFTNCHLLIKHTKQIRHHCPFLGHKWARDQISVLPITEEPLHHLSHNFLVSKKPAKKMSA